MFSTSFLIVKIILIIFLYFIIMIIIIGSTGDLIQDPAHTSLTSLLKRKIKHVE